MDAQQHWEAWLARYGSVYDSEELRQGAYRDALEALDELRELSAAPRGEHTHGHSR
jgi:hypothetical protein